MLCVDPPNKFAVSDMNETNSGGDAVEATGAAGLIDGLSFVSVADLVEGEPVGMPSVSAAPSSGRARRPWRELLHGETAYRAIL